MLADKFSLTEVTHDILVQHGICSKNELVKILGRGELKGKMNVSAHGFSATAKAAIESNGGVVTVL
jgi:large subunit ribosomal protein L15